MDPDDDLLLAKLDEYVPLVVCGMYKLPLVVDVDLLGEITGILCECVCSVCVVDD